jgi:hypothetical protein
MLRAALLSLFLGGAICAGAKAHHFAIDLKARASKESRTAQAEMLAPGVKAKPRAVLHVKAGQRVAVQWTLTNTDRAATYKEVLVHFFVVKEDQVGQQLVPKLLKGVVAESALTMDFRPGDRNRGELSFVIDQPGDYLLRLETIGAAVGADGHEHYAALDVVVK